MAAWLARVGAMSIKVILFLGISPTSPDRSHRPLRAACHMHFALMADGSGQDIRLRALLYILFI